MPRRASAAIPHRYPGGSSGLETTNPADGSKALYFTHPGGAGNGGGYGDFDYVPVSEFRSEILSWIHWATAAGMKNQVIVRFYDKDKVYLSSMTLYDSTSNPTSPKLMAGEFVPPADARFMRVRVVGGESSGDVARTAYFDGVRIGVGWQGRVDGTISEQSTLEYSYVDAGSVSITLPVLSVDSIIRLCFFAEARVSTTGDYSTKQLFRIGSAYSNYISPPSTSYVANAFEMTLLGVSGTQTLYQQLQADGATSYGKKAVSKISYQILQS